MAKFEYFAKVITYSKSSEQRFAVQKLSIVGRPEPRPPFIL